MAGLWLLGSCGVPLAQAQTRTADANAPTLLVLGDSLSAEYGLRRGSGGVALLERKLATEKSPVQVVNASVSGDTTSGGRSRLPGLLQEHRPAVVVIELGGNDALRGLPLDLTRDNLSAMAQQARASGAKVLLLGMQLPPNYGQRYTRAFAAVYENLATEKQVPLVPFFLEGVGGVAGMIQADGIHPTVSAQPRLLDNVWP